MNFSMAKPAENTGYVEEMSRKLKHGLAVHKVTRSQNVQPPAN